MNGIFLESMEQRFEDFGNNTVAIVELRFGDFGINSGAVVSLFKLVIKPLNIIIDEEGDFLVIDRIEILI